MSFKIGLFLASFFSIFAQATPVSKMINCQAQVENNMKQFSLNQSSMIDEDGLHSSSVQVDDYHFRVAYVGGDQILLSIKKNKSDRTHIVVDSKSKIPKVILDVIDGRKGTLFCETEL